MTSRNDIIFTLLMASEDFLTNVMLMIWMVMYFWMICNYLYILIMTSVSRWYTMKHNKLPSFASMTKIVPDGIQLPFLCNFVNIYKFIHIFFHKQHHKYTEVLKYVTIIKFIHSWLSETENYSVSMASNIKIISRLKKCR